jgi:hypothetical protein
MSAASDVTLGTGGTHAVVAFATNDSSTWMCTDAWDSSGFNHTGARHSFFTTDSYATPAAYSFNKWNWMIRLAGAPPTPGGGLFLVNGLTSGTMKPGATISLQFWSSDGSAPILYLMVLNAGGPLISFLPVTSLDPLLIVRRLVLSPARVHDRPDLTPAASSATTSTRRRTQEQDQAVELQAHHRQGPRSARRRLLRHPR